MSNPARRVHICTPPGLLAVVYSMINPRLRALHWYACYAVSLLQARMRLAEESIGAPQHGMISAHRPPSVQGTDQQPALAWLTSLNISQCSRVTDAGIAALAGLTTLEELDMSCCIHVNRAGFAALATLPYLSSLTVSRMMLSIGSLESIGCMTGKRLSTSCHTATHPQLGPAIYMEVLYAMLKSLIFTCLLRSVSSLHSVIADHTTTHGKIVVCTSNFRQACKICIHWFTPTS